MFGCFFGTSWSFSDRGLQEFTLLERGKQAWALTWRFSTGALELVVNLFVGAGALSVKCFFERSGNFCGPSSFIICWKMFLKSSINPPICIEVVGLPGLALDR